MGLERQIVRVLLGGSLVAGCVGGGDVVGGRAAADDVRASRRACAAGETDVACCPTGWLPAQTGGCAPPRVVCTGVMAASAACVRALTAPRDETERFWQWDARRSEHPWFQGWTCPTGWTPLPDGSCRSATNTRCPVGELPLPDGTCTETGERVCGAAEFPDAPADATRVVYVRDGAPDTAAGTRDAPVGSLARALDLAGEGGAVLVTDGTYTLTRTFTGRASIVGRCPARVTIHRAAESMFEPIVRATGEGARVYVEGVTLDTYERTLEAYDGAELTVHRVIAKAFGIGVLAMRRGRVRGDHVIVQNIDLRMTLDRPSNIVMAGGSVTLDHAVIGMGGRAFVDEGPANNLVLRHVSVVGTRGSSWLEGNVLLEDVRMEAPDETVGMQLNGPVAIDGLHFYCDDCTTGWHESGALRLFDGTHATLRRVRFDGWRGIAIQTQLADLDLEDIALDGTPSTGVHGGIELASSTLIGRRIQMRGIKGQGLIGVSFSRVDVRDLRMREQRPPEPGDYSVGVAHAVGGTMTITRAALDDMPMAAIAAASLPRQILVDDPAVVARLDPQIRARAALLSAQSTNVSFTDVLTSMVRSPPDVANAAVLSASNANLSLQRAALYDSYGVGLLTTSVAVERYYAVRALVIGTSLLAMYEQLSRTLLDAVRPEITGPASLDVDGLYLGPVHRGGALTGASVRPSPLSEGQSWAAFAGEECAMRLHDALVQGGPESELGVVSGGAVTIQRSIVRDFPSCPTAIVRAAPNATLRVENSRVEGPTCSTNRTLGFLLSLPTN